MLLYEALAFADTVLSIDENDVPGPAKKRRWQTKMSESGTGKQQDIEDKMLWNRKLDNTFLQVMAEVKLRNGMWATAKFTQSGWDEVAHDFHAHTGRRYSRDQLQGKYQGLRKSWMVMRWIITDNSGIGWDPVQSMFVTPEEQWQSIIQKRKAVKSFRRTGLPNYDLITEIFRDIVAVGTFAWSSMQPPLTDDEKRELEICHQRTTQRLPFPNMSDDSDDDLVEIDCTQPFTQSGGSSGSKRRGSASFSDIPASSGKSIKFNH